jgi:hypothetical protein
MEQIDDKANNEVSNQVSDKTKKANIRLAIILGVVVLLGMSSTFFMLSEKL